ncbi:hypothetical protein LHJ74_30730 [Streptomyces sp. N2-109]|uniref:Uncharacterized protein n=1 Tax=Streptomyces gossypii TaxID=2883101 RepID=A0ABT2K238_9ACTN|nr:hypothetical protein [Streptomyces gossypii]MCT2594232.1 hypothetical protein [Streptomyces gossypii]
MNYEDGYKIRYSITIGDQMDNYVFMDVLIDTVWGAVTADDVGRAVHAAMVDLATEKGVLPVNTAAMEVRRSVFPPEVAP